MTPSRGVEGACQSGDGESSDFAFELPSPSVLSEGLRRRLQSAAEGVTANTAAARHDAEEEASKRSRSVKELLAPLRAQADAWPTAHARSGREKAKVEIEA